MRLRAVLLILMLAAGGMITIDRVSPPADPVRATIAFDPEGGVLTCPYLTEPDGNAAIQLANLGTSASSIRILIPLQKGNPVSISLSLAPNAVKTVDLPARAKVGRTGAVIEYAGGVVVASHTLYLSARKGPASKAAGVSVAPCQGTGKGDVVVTYADTLRSDARLALFNPGSAGADVSVTLLADGRRIQPVRLSRRLVPSHARRDFELGDYAFNTRNLTAVIHANAGRIAAEVLLRSRTGAELLPGQTPSTELVAVSGRNGTLSDVSTTVVGTDDTGFAVRLITNGAQLSARGFPPSLTPGGGRIVGIPAQRKTSSEAAFAISVEVGSPLVAATRWTTRGRDDHAEFASLPASPPVPRWGGVIGGLGRFAVVRIVVVNPGSTPIPVRMLTLDSSSRSSVRKITVPPGRLVVLLLGKGSGPFAFLVDAGGPVSAAVSSNAVARNGTITTTALLATPLTPARAEGVLVDPAAGVPAILPTS